MSDFYNQLTKIMRTTRKSKPTEIFSPSNFSFKRPKPKLNAAPKNSKASGKLSNKSSPSKNDKSEKNESKKILIEEPSEVMQIDTTAMNSTIAERRKKREKTELGSKFTQYMAIEEANRQKKI